jgi:hypothetical protein
MFRLPILGSSKVTSFLLLSNKLYRVMHLMNFISAAFSLLITHCFNVQISQPYKNNGIAWDI